VLWQPMKIYFPIKWSPHPVDLLRLVSRLTLFVTSIFS